MKKALIRNLVIASSLFIILVSFQNCGQVQNSMNFASIVPPPPEAVVCGGFENEQGQPQTQNFGIVGNIFVSNQASNPGSALRYASEAPALRTDAGDIISIYLNNVDVPTRTFTDGFVNQSGETLKDNDGNALIEYFGLKLNFTLKLPDDLEPGFYQIGIESDDGSVFKILGSDNQMKTHVNNDGTHSTATKCAAESIYFNDTTRVPSELYYFQGPRTHIAMRLVWKKVDSATPSTSCGTIGAANGTAASNYWKVIPSTAFELPGNPQQNPCVE